MSLFYISFDGAANAIAHDDAATATTPMGG